MTKNNVLISVIIAVALLSLIGLSMLAGFVQQSGYAAVDPNTIKLPIYSNLWCDTCPIPNVLKSENLKTNDSFFSTSGTDYTFQCDESNGLGVSSYGGCDVTLTKSEGAIIADFLGVVGHYSIQNISNGKIIVSSRDFVTSFSTLIGKTRLKYGEKLIVNMQHGTGTLLIEASSYCLNIRDGQTLYYWKGGANQGCRISGSWNVGNLGRIQDLQSQIRSPVVSLDHGVENVIAKWQATPIDEIKKNLADNGYITFNPTSGKPTLCPIIPSTDGKWNIVDLNHCNDNAGIECVPSTSTNCIKGKIFVDKCDTSGEPSNVLGIHSVLKGDKSYLCLATCQDGKISDSNCVEQKGASGGGSCPSGTTLQLDSSCAVTGECDSGYHLVQVRDEVCGLGCSYLGFAPEVITTPTCVADDNGLTLALIILAVVGGGLFILVIILLTRDGRKKSPPRRSYRPRMRSPTNFGELRI